MATETEYVDAGEAVDFRNLSPGYIGTAPDVAKGPRGGAPQLAHVLRRL
jgi:hypothetical protein